MLSHGLREAPCRSFCRALSHSQQEFVWVKIPTKVLKPFWVLSMWDFTLIAWFLLPQSCLQHVQCNRFVSALLHAVCEQIDVCSRPWLQQPALLQHHPHTPAELCMPEQGSQPRAWEMLLAFVWHVWHEQNVLPEIKGVWAGRAWSQSSFR